MKQDKNQVPQSPSTKVKKPTNEDSGHNLTVSQAPSSNNKEPSIEEGEEGRSSFNKGDAEAGTVSYNQGDTEVGLTSIYHDTPPDESNKKSAQIEAQNNNTNDAKNIQTSPILLRRNCLARRDPDFLWM